MARNDAKDIPDNFSDIDANVNRACGLKIDIESKSDETLSTNNAHSFKLILQSDDTTSNVKFCYCCSSISPDRAINLIGIWILISAIGQTRSLIIQLC